MSEVNATPSTAAQKGTRRRFLKGALVGGAVALAASELVGNRYTLGEGSDFKPRGFSRARPIVTDPGPPPARVDVVIIGGGLSGVCSAFNIAKRGLSVAVLEKGVIAGEASGRSAGMIESLFNPASQLELIEYSKQRWRTLNTAIAGETGFQQAGNTELFVDEADLEEARAWLEAVKGLPNAGARILSAAQAQDLMPGTAVRLIGGLQAPEDASAEPVLAAPAIAVGAMNAGARIFQNCAVRGIEMQGGRVAGVITEHGPVRTSIVVLAGGVWSPVLAQGLGLSLPMAQGWVSMASVLPLESGPIPGDVSVIGPNVGWRKQFDGSYAIWQFAAIGPILPDEVRHVRQFLPLLRANWSLVGMRFSARTFSRWWQFSRPVPLDRPGVFEENRIYEPELRARVIDAGIARLQDVMPPFRSAAVSERWNGAMSMTPDTKPVLAEVSSVPGLVMATGIYHGLTVGPGVGEIVADLVTGKKAAIDISHFRYERLIDGSTLDVYS